jgi:tRNA threonylcarbamoyladenosine biosynthesis protein TsaE
MANRAAGAFERPPPLHGYRMRRAASVRAPFRVILAAVPHVPTGEFVTHSAEETFELAYGIGEALERGAVFLLEGDLGAGKTVFAKGLGAGLDIDPAEVNSPTFTLVNAHDGRTRLYHLDLYRLAGGAGEVYDLGLDEMIAEPNAVVVIEWAERLGDFVIPEAYSVRIVDAGVDSRKITIERR